ncbi:hypothetical protein DVH24_039412, partial [Malus domestica]
QGLKWDLESQKQKAIPIYLGSRGFRCISNFHLDWATVDFQVRMGKVCWSSDSFSNYFNLPSFRSQIVKAFFVQTAHKKFMRLTTTAGSREHLAVELCFEPRRLV